jgi:GR25 family glycosyltransferase involved in LPS biosynthesis
MKIQRYLVCWDDVYDNCINIESEFKSSGFDITVINSGKPKNGWHNVGDIRYYRQFYYALKNFDFNNDYMLYICGDLSSDKWINVLNRSESVLSNYENIYLYAPHFTNDPWSFYSTNIKISKQDDNLSIATNTNGLMFFMHKDIVKEMLDFFDYFEEKYGWESMVSGWAIDMLYSAIAIYNNKFIVRDSLFIVNHPQGSSYNHGKASQESALIFNAINEWSPKYNDVIDKIRKRMEQNKNFKNILSFYGKDLDLSIIKKDIDYHIIYINDERKNNIDNINEQINGKLHNIKSVNAKDPLEKTKFFDKNKDFYLSWTGFKDGEIGNFASHYNAWKYVIENNLDRLLVFEDDAIIDSLFAIQYNLFLDFCPKDYDVFSMFVAENQYNRFNKSDIINSYISKGYQDWSTLCYVISNGGAHKLVNYIKKNGMDYPTDWFIFRNGHKNIFNVYTFRPKYCRGVHIDFSYNSQVQ